MQYIQLNPDNTFLRHVAGKIVWDATHYCKPEALTTEEATLFRVVTFTRAAEPTYNANTHYSEWATEPALVGQDWILQINVLERTVAAAKTRMIDEAGAVYRQKKEGGITVSGLPVQTDGHTIAEILGATKHTNPNRKRRIGGQTVALSAQMLNSLEDAITAHIDATDLFHCDLCDSITAQTTLVQLDAIDVTAGWPSTDY